MRTFFLVLAYLVAFCVLVLLCAVVLSGCGSTTITRDSSTVTTVRDTVLWVVPSEISDTVYLNQDNTGASVKGRDTVIRVQYFPKEHRVYVTARPDTVFLKYKDTTTVTQTNVTIKEKTFWERVTGWVGSQVFTLAAIAGVVILILFIIRRKS